MYTKSTIQKRQKSCFAQYIVGTRIKGTPTNVRTTNVGNDKRQNDKRQKGQT